MVQEMARMCPSVCEIVVDNQSSVATNHSYQTMCDLFLPYAAVSRYCYNAAIVYDSLVSCERVWFVCARTSLCFVSVRHFLCN